MASHRTAGRTRLIYLLLLIIAFVSPMAAYRYLNPPPKYKAKYQTIAHRFLDLESHYVTIPDGSHELLDELITETQTRFAYSSKITDLAGRREQCLRLFNTIDEILIERNFVFPAGRYTTTLGEALMDSTLSASELAETMRKPHNERRAWHMKEHSGESFHLAACEPSAFLYMGIAEAVGVELKPVLLPEHVFVRAQLDQGHWVNWDPNRGRSINDADYVNDWHVAQWQVTAKVFMQPLSPGQIEAEMYGNIGSYLGDHAAMGGMESAIECQRKAIQLNSTAIYARCNLAMDLLFTPDPSPAAVTEAAELSLRAIDLQPNDACTQISLAYARAAAGQVDEAVAAMDRAIRLSPKKSELPEIRSLLQSGHTMYGAFKAQSPIAMWIGYERGWAYILLAMMLAAGAIITFRVSRARSQCAEPMQVG